MSLEVKGSTFTLTAMLTPLALPADNP